MTVETEVANLTTAVDNLASAVNVKKATLDASVADAQSAQSAAASSATTASGHATSAAASAAAAASTATGIAGFDLDAIAASKAVTAVDVFVYDTSKDSDGGAWRKRTQHTSWYNETLNTATRGSRREFPAVAVIVAESNKVTIYDGDDPALPMWMVFNNTGLTAYTASVTSLAMTNGVLSFGGTAGLFTVEFLSEIMRLRQAGNDRWQFNISTRNTAALVVNGIASYIVNAIVNDVAMTVLPDAPIDPATGLPVPVIAVATNGGVSVITDSGAVYDSVWNADTGLVNFTQDNGLWYFRSASAVHRAFYATQEDYTAGDGFGDEVADDRAGIQEFTLLTRSQASSVMQSDFAVGGFSGSVNSAVDGLMLHKPDYSDFTKGMSALTTSTYNTGWMNGDIKGAFLSDTDTTSLVGSGELVTNGTFDTDTSGWSADNANLSSVSGEFVVENSATAFGRGYQAITTVAGKTYVIQVERIGGTCSNYDVQVRDSSIGGTILLNSGAITSTGTQVFYFTAQSSTSVVRVGNATSTSGLTGIFDNISVKLADADRSVNNKGLIVNGTVTRSAVATGAELVAYSGFSASNYLEQPYNSALDFGTGDFCVMGWVKGATSLSTANIVSRCSGGTNGFQLWKETTSVSPYARFRIGSTVLSGTTGITNQWNHVVAVRKSGVAYIYKNGVLESSTAATADVSGAYVTQVGWSTTNPLIAALAGVSLLRISATAPTAEAIKKIYEDEKVLFQENAAATLYGASDAVTALAHDSDTGLLHVGTSAGRSVFQGLRRVSNTTTAVGTAISAANNLIVEE